MYQKFVTSRPRWHKYHDYRNIQSSDLSKRLQPTSLTPGGPTCIHQSNISDGQKVSITFVDQDDNNKEVGKVVESGKSGELIGTTNYATRRKEFDGAAGYGSEKS